MNSIETKNRVLKFEILNSGKRKSVFKRMIDINRKFHKRVLIVCHICVYEATDDDIVMRGSSQPAAVEPESSPLDEPESSFQRQKVIGIRRGWGTSSRDDITATLSRGFIAQQINSLYWHRCLRSGLAGDAAKEKLNRRKCSLDVDGRLERSKVIAEEVELRVAGGGAVRVRRRLKWR